MPFSGDDFFIAFGPLGSYIVRAPKISRTNIPLATSDLKSKVENAKWINYALFTATGDPYISYSAGMMSKASFPDSNPIPDLQEWIKHRMGTGGVQVVGDGREGWWAHSTASTKWSSKLPRDVRQYLKTHPVHKKATIVALGVEGAYVIGYEDGHVDWDLKGRYEELDLELESRGQSELIYISLSAFEGNRFFAAFKDQTVFYQFAEDDVAPDEDFLSAEALRVVVHSDTAKHTGMPVKKAPGALRRITGELLMDATKDVIEESIGAAAYSDDVQDNDSDDDEAEHRPSTKPRSKT